MNDLALQIALIDQIVIDHADMPNPGRGQIEQCRRSESARADHQHAALEQLLLAGFAHFWQKQMPAIAL